jgi:hypothetical protein
MNLQQTIRKILREEFKSHNNLQETVRKVLREKLRQEKVVLNEQKISLPIILRDSYTAPKGDGDALHSFERRKSDGFGGKMTTKIDQKLKEVYDSGINPDLVSLKIVVDSSQYKVTWEAIIDESKDGKAYMGSSTRGSAGGGADRRALGQLDKLKRQLSRNGAEDITEVLDFVNPTGVYIRQYFFKYTLPKKYPPYTTSGDYDRTQKPSIINLSLDDPSSQTELASNTQYSVCVGDTYKKGCKDIGTKYNRPNYDGIIYKVQGCIGTIQDGFFGKKTEKSLKEKFGKSEFKLSDVDTICKDSETDNISGSQTNFKTITKFIIDNFEGGYWNPFCKHPTSSMGKSTETMFGLDRYNGNIESKPDGKKFFEIIDNAKTDAGATSSGSGKNMTWSNMSKFCKTWKWLYRGGDKEDELKDLAVNIMKTVYDRNMSNYVKSDKTREKIETIPALTLHMSYASWNGPGYFQTFAKDLTNAVNQGKSDKELIDVGLKSRTDDRRMNKPKVLAAISKLKNSSNIS